MRWTSLALLGCLVSNVSWADVANARRLALVVGKNRGIAGEVPLLYAERDALRVAEVLRDLGEFAPPDIHTVLGGRAPEVRSALQRLLLRASPGQKSVLFFYYSGHASSEALHLAGTSFSLEQLMRDVGEIPAALKVVVLDACRSGSVTRVKGAKQVPRFEIEVADRLEAEGLAILTSSAAGENSQESEELEASFFTHHFASALVGAGDQDADGEVTLAEAFRYASSQTLSATASTLAGPQHATFRYELGGRGDVTLTWPSRKSSAFGRLLLETTGSFLVRRETATGSVVAELAAGRPQQRLTLPPGRYYLVKREPDHFLEATVQLTEGKEAAVPATAWIRRAYDRRTLKGEERYSPHMVSWNAFQVAFNRVELEYAQRVRSFGSFFIGGQYGYGPVLFTRSGVELGLRSGARFTVLGDAPEGLCVDAGLSALFWSWPTADPQAPGGTYLQQGFAIGPAAEVGFAGVFFKRWLVGASFRLEYLFGIGGDPRYGDRLFPQPTLKTGVVF